MGPPDRRLLLDRGQDLGMGFEVAVELFQRLEGFGADVVFHAFDVVVDDLFFEAEQGQKLGE